jgi:ribokinase
VPGASTGVALIVVDAAGENLIAVAPGVNALVTPELVASAFDRLAPCPGDVILAGHEIPTAAAREALRLGRAAGATTILNPAPAAGIDRAILALVDVLTPNQGELAELLGAEARWPRGSPAERARAPHEAAALLEAGPDGPGAGAVLVSLGPVGAVLIRPDFPPLTITAPRVEAVDATGAGDALNGALAAQLAAGKELTEAATLAVLAATSSTRRAGARAGLIDAAELDRLVAPPAAG